MYIGTFVRKGYGEGVLQRAAFWLLLPLRGRAQGPGAVLVMAHYGALLAKQDCINVRTFL